MKYTRDGTTNRKKRMRPKRATKTIKMNAQLMGKNALIEEI